MPEQHEVLEGISRICLDEYDAKVSEAVQAERMGDTGMRVGWLQGHAAAYRRIGRELHDAAEAFRGTEEIEFDLTPADLFDNPFGEEVAA